MWKGAAIGHRDRQKLLCCPCSLQTTNNLSFFLVRRAKHARHENDHTHDWRLETGEARFLLWQLPSFLVSCGTIARACTPLTKSKEKKRLLAVYYFLTSLGSHEQWTQAKLKWSNYFLRRSNSFTRRFLLSLVAIKVIRVVSFLAFLPFRDLLFLGLLLNRFTEKWIKYLLLTKRQGHSNK